VTLLIAMLIRDQFDPRYLSNIADSDRWPLFDVFGERIMCCWMALSWVAWPILRSVRIAVCRSIPDTLYLDGVSWPQAYDPRSVPAVC
jgi:hypothetical protein